MSKVEIIQLISAGIGGLYVLARAIIIATPTKKDDQYLDKKINPILRGLSFLFGLDLRQGIKKYSP